MINKVQSSTPLEDVTVEALPTGGQFIRIRRNKETTEDQEGGTVYQADEAAFFYDGRLTAEEAKSDVWWAYGAAYTPKEDKVDPVAAMVSRVESLTLAASIAFVTMAEAGQIDQVTAGEHADVFAAWEYPVSYKTGAIRSYAGRLYKCLSDHTSQVDWTPDKAASLWTGISDPADEWPVWSQPVGAHDAYNKGDKVTHKGQHYTSTCDANVWEPGVYGWEAA